MFKCNEKLNETQLCLFISELFETEKNHVKILKVLHNVFMVPLEQSKAMTPELIQLVFPPSLLVLKEWHNSFEAMLKQRWKEQNTFVKEIGEYLNVVSFFKFVPFII
jgi:Rho guanine nucleotide exchange factor 12